MVGRPKILRRAASGAGGLHLSGLRGVRSAIAMSHRRLDRRSPAVETHDLVIPTPAGPLKARLYRPRRARPGGAGLVFFHGGGFVVCDIETHDGLCRRLADSAGLAIISVDYRLAPEAAFPAQLADGEAATRWIRSQAAPLGIAPSRLLLGGDSAGGYIAVATAATLNQESPGAVAGLLLIYPLLELDDEAWASSLFAHSRIVGRVALGFIRNQLGVDAPTPSLAGIGLAPLPPTLIAVGGPLDPCRPDARRLAARLRQAGKLTALLEYPRLPHGFASFTHLSAAARFAVAQIGEGLGRLAESDGRG